MPWGLRRGPALRRVAARRGWGLFLFCALLATGCASGLLEPKYEYEEELYLSLDGSARLNLNASVAALVALRGVNLPTDPQAYLDRRKVRALFERPGSPVTVSVSRRDGRRFVHVSVEVDDVQQLAQIRPFAWSTYRFVRRDDVFEFRQVVGPPAPPTIDPGWDGTELVAFRMHLPSRILFHNAAGIDRGNILEWEQPLAARLGGERLDLQAHLATESILYTTLLLFAATIGAAAVTFAAVVWWVARRGRGADMVESHT